MRTRNSLLLTHELPGTGLLLPQLVPSCRRSTLTLLTQSRRVSLGHTAPQRNDRSRIRLLTTTLLAGPTLSLTLRLRSRTRGFTA